MKFYLYEDANLNKMAHFFCKAIFELPFSINIFYFKALPDDTFWGCTYLSDSYGVPSPTDYIYVSDAVKNNELKLVDVLLHELCHYSLWYRGFDYGDDSIIFDKLLKDLGVSSNFYPEYRDDRKLMFFLRMFLDYSKNT